MALKAVREIFRQESGPPRRTGWRGRSRACPPPDKILSFPKNRKRIFSIADAAASVKPNHGKGGKGHVGSVCGPEPIAGGGPAGGAGHDSIQYRLRPPGRGGVDAGFGGRPPPGHHRRWRGGVRGRPPGGGAAALRREPPEAVRPHQRPGGGSGHDLRRPVGGAVPACRPGPEGGASASAGGGGGADPRRGKGVAGHDPGGRGLALGAVRRCRLPLPRRGGGGPSEGPGGPAVPV